MGLNKIWRFYISGRFGVFWIVLRPFSAVLGRFGSFGSVLAIRDCQIRLATVKSDNLTSVSRRYIQTFGATAVRPRLIDGWLSTFYFVSFRTAMTELKELFFKNRYDFESISNLKPWFH